MLPGAAAASIAAVAGAWAHPGGGALYAQYAAFGLDRTLIDGADRIDPSTRVLDMSRIGPVLCGDPADIGGGPPVRALFIQNTNPMVVAPESLKVRDGFRRDDLFVCVHEQFMTETAAMADVVLPATTFLEHDDIYLAGGHSFLQASPAIIAPIGESRSNHDVLAGLAARLGAEHPSFALSARELADASLRRSGLPGWDDLVAMGGYDCVDRQGDPSFADGFGHADGKYHFRADWRALGPLGDRMPAWPDHWDAIETADDAHPFRLVTASAQAFLNSSFAETPTSRARAKRPTVLATAADLDRLGIAAGALVRLSNARGAVQAHVDAAEGQRDGVLVLEGLWPNGAFVGGVGVNALVGAEPGAPHGRAAFPDVAVAPAAVA